MNLNLFLRNYSTFLCLILTLLINHQTYSQVTRIWDYSYSLGNNSESSGNSIIALPSGKTVTAGEFKNSSSFDRRNILLFTDETGALLDVDTSTYGSGFRKVIYDGLLNIYALATLKNDSNTVSKIVVAKFDSTFTNKRFFIPDSSSLFPSYQAFDISLLSNSNIVIASIREEFSNLYYSVLCMDSSGTKLWESVDSTLESNGNIKILEDSAGGVFVAGSGFDTSSGQKSILVSHYTNTGIRDWSFRYFSGNTSITDLIKDVTGNLYLSGYVNDIIFGDGGFLTKVDVFGNIVWNKLINPLYYERIISDYNGNVYGAEAPLNGVGVFKIDKLDSSGTFIDSSVFQLPGYSDAELGDIRILDNGNIIMTGGLFNFSQPKADLFLAAFDTSLNMLGYNTFDSLNLLGETGRALVPGNDGSVFVCGRLNYESNLETSNIGLIKYNLSGIFNTVSTINQMAFEIFPNPSSGSLTFRWSDSQKGKTLIHIFNYLGAEVFRDVVSDHFGQRNYDLNLRPGFYNAIAETQSGRVVRKVCIVEY